MTEKINLFLAQHYGLQEIISTQQLAGEFDLNFRVQTNEETYLVKIADEVELEVNLDEQNRIMQFLKDYDFDFEVSQIIPNKDGQLIGQIELSSGKYQYIRCLSWIGGMPLAKVSLQKPALLENIGHSCGQLMQALGDFYHASAQRWHKWDIQNANWVKEHLSLLDADIRPIAEKAIAKFESVIHPSLKRTRQSVIYNDANDYNILVHKKENEYRVAGLIDFGDAIFSHPVIDAAVTITYAAMDQAIPLDAALNVLRGYHKAFPLSEKELELLYDLVMIRVIVSLTVGTLNRHNEPDNEYLQISQAAAKELLKKWDSISESYAYYAFRQACGMEACPKASDFRIYMQEEQAHFHPIVNLQGEQPYFMDLGVGSWELGNNSQFDTIEAFEETINQVLKQSGKTYGIGGYGEIRPVYTTDAYLVQGNMGPQWRTVHLGMDIWGPAYTKVYAPIDGVVHSFQNNDHERDYGPTIILEHKVSDQLTFYTLYGHLSHDSIIDLQIGQVIKKGQEIARFGDAHENGQWPPHLHFQVMLDLLEKSGDFPGVGFPSEQEVWLSICPDGTPFCKTSTPNHREKISAKQILSTRKKVLGRSLSISYKKKLHMLRGYKQYLYEADGRRYLDTANNVAHVGHEHPAVVAAGQKQMAVLNTNTRYLHPEIVQYAEELLATFPPELNVVHFVNSGSEANEVAMRMAQTWSGQKDFLVMEIGYHGNTTGCIDISSYKFDGKGGRGASDHIHVMPMPDVYRGIHRDPNTAGKVYADYLEKKIQELKVQGKAPAGFFCESILSCGGQIVLPEDYLKEAYQHVRKAGGLCIADEVQTGFGRVGSHFWAFELQGVVPDVVTLGKPIGNGHPLGAVVTTEAVANAFANGMEYFNTFGGNPVSCSIGRAVLKTVKEEGLQQNALDVGNYLLAGLGELQKEFPFIGHLRGHGLFLGIELVKDPALRNPNAEAASYLANSMRELGILMSTDGPDYNVMKIKPPICFSKENADFLLEMMRKVMKDI
ncbi:MAG: aminotransferase class III-fold pyridoxal phosphate-dependent enzyme [Bacteroidota bacterium]